MADEDAPAPVACPVCKSERTTIEGQIPGKTWYRCEDCGHRFLVDSRS